MFNQRLRETFQGARVYPHRRLSAVSKKTNDMDLDDNQKPGFSRQC